jgi:hypothetical protein
MSVVTAGKKKRRMGLRSGTGERLMADGDDDERRG